MDSYFYDRWKTVDDRQQSANKSSAEGNVPVVSREALKHASVPHGDIKHHFENDTQVEKHFRAGGGVAFFYFYLCKIRGIFVLGALVYTL